MQPVLVSKQQLITAIQESLPGRLAPLQTGRSLGRDGAVQWSLATMRPQVLRAVSESTRSTVDSAAAAGGCGSGRPSSVTATGARPSAEPAVRIPIGVSPTGSGAAGLGSGTDSARGQNRDDSDAAGVDMSGSGEAMCRVLRCRSEDGTSGDTVGVDLLNTCMICMRVRDQRTCMAATGCGEDKVSCCCIGG